MPTALRQPGIVRRSLIASTLITLAVALLANLILEFFQTGGYVGLSRFLWGADAARFCLDVTVLWTVVAGVSALVGRLWVSSGLVLAAASLIGSASREKLEWRREPLYPSDLSMSGQLGFFSRIVGPEKVVLAALLSVSLFAVCLLVGRILKERLPRLTRVTDRALHRRLLVARLVTVGASSLLLLYAGQFNHQGNKLRALFDSTGAIWRPWSAQDNYLANGFVTGFLYNLKAPAMTEPSGYSAKTMRAIAHEYGKDADAVNTFRDSHVLDDVNVVVVLSESFSDPTRLHGISAAEDPIPFTRHLMRSTRSGQVLTQAIGGGTANMEFETLTSMSMAQFSPQLNTPYHSLIPRFSTFPSAVQYFGGLGHDTIAIHPFEPWFYDRTEVYRAMGFDEFISAAEMSQKRKIDRGLYISDASAFNEVEHQIAVHAKPVFVNLVTMQNHAPHGRFRSPIPVSGLPAGSRDAASQYLRGLRLSDDALSAFLRQLTTSDEKTVVLLYGDHLPGIWPSNVRAESGELVTHETPYFIWKNFGTNVPEVTPVISPVYLVPGMLDVLDAPLPPYYALLERLRDEFPAMNMGLYLDRLGHEIPMERVSQSARRLLHDYRLVQYDLSVGHRYSERAMLGVPSAQMAIASGQ